MAGIEQVADVQVNAEAPGHAATTEETETAIAEVEIEELKRRQDKLNAGIEEDDSRWFHVIDQREVR